jgi:hypothetical protein
MKNYITTFGQILSFLPEKEFKKSVEALKTDKYSKKFTHYELLKILLYAQITGKESLRDIVTGLSMHVSQFYHLGIGEISRSNLSYANNHRNYQVFEETFYALFDRCSRNARSSKFKFKNPIYALDSTKIDLCLSLFPWAKYRTKKGAIKLHHLLDLKSNLPAFMVIEEGKKHDVAVARALEFPISSDSIIVMDRGYIDFKWFWSFEQKDVFFVTRAKKNCRYRVLGQHSLNDSTSVIADEVIELSEPGAFKDYPKSLRLVTFYDKENDKVYRFLTNNFKFAASTIAEIYKSRWQIETFFRWIKQNLKIKSFLGTTKNAVMEQIWAAMIYYLLLAWIKFQTKFAWSILELSRRINATLFEKVHLLNLLSKTFKKPTNSINIPLN